MRSLGRLTRGKGRLTASAGNCEVRKAMMRFRNWLQLAAAKIPSPLRQIFRQCGFGPLERYLRRKVGSASQPTWNAHTKERITRGRDERSAGHDQASSLARCGPDSERQAPRNWRRSLARESDRPRKLPRRTGPCRAGTRQQVSTSEPCTDLNNLAAANRTGRLQETVPCRPKCCLRLARVGEAKSAH